jgi:hypothetical protein
VRNDLWQLLSFFFSNFARFVWSTSFAFCIRIRSHSVVLLSFDVHIHQRPGSQGFHGAEGYPNTAWAMILLAVVVGFVASIVVLTVILTVGNLQKAVAPECFWKFLIGESRHHKFILPGVVGAGYLEGMRIAVINLRGLSVSYRPTRVVVVAAVSTGFPPHKGFHPRFFRRRTFLPRRCRCRCHGPSRSRFEVVFVMDCLSSLL